MFHLSCTSTYSSDPIVSIHFLIHLFIHSTTNHDFSQIIPVIHHLELYSNFFRIFLHHFSNTTVAFL